MQIAGIQVEARALDGLRRSGAVSWLAFGPAAARAAIPLAIDQSDPVRALNYLAANRPSGTPSNLLATLADRWLDSSTADRLVSSTGRLLRDVARTPPGAGTGAGGGAPWWPGGGGVGEKLLAAEARELRNILPAAAFTPGLTPQSGAMLAHDIFAYAPDPKGGISFGGGPPRQTYYSQLAMQAETAEPAAVATPPLPRIDRQQFRAAAGVLGAGFAGLAAGALASTLGAPALLSWGLGGVAAAGAIWRISPRLPDVDLSFVWKAFTDVVGQAVDGVLSWLTPGSGSPAPVRNAASGSIPAAAAAGDLLTLADSGVATQLYESLWD